jgi:transketolase
MMKIDSSFFNTKNIKTWSIIGSRATFGLVSNEIAKNNPKLMILTADVSTSAGLDKFKKNFNKNYIDVGISEQNLIGVATGLSRKGFDVITTTFSPFQTLRCCEQIKVNLGYMNEKVVLVGLASGLVLGSLGYTHCSIEDVGALRSIPNITIISPADSLETAKAIFESINSKNSVYIRLTGGSPNPIVYDEDYQFEIGKAITIKKGERIAIVATGASVSESLNARKILEQEKIFPEIINMHTIKPVDKEMIKNLSKKFENIVSVEEHNIIGGLGSAIAEEISGYHTKTKLHRIGINDRYSKSGSYNFMKNTHKISSNFICEKVKEILKD